MNIQLKPMITEKAVMLIEMQNTLTFRTEKGTNKMEMKKEIEKVFGVKVDKIRVIVRENHKYFYVKLKKQFPAIDVATKIGLM